MAHLFGPALAARTKNKWLVVLHGVFRRAQTVWGLPVNPVTGIEKYRQRSSGDVDVFSPEEVLALVRAAGDEQDAAIYLTAAFTGLRRGELLALRWRDVDFAGQAIRVRASFAGGQVTSPKSGKVRSVPMAPDVASALAALGRRERWTGDDDLVFVGTLGSPVDGSALRRRYTEALRRAGLRPLRFHDLRHTFGTRIIAKADIRRVQEWMCHADVQTTMKYLHYAPRDDDAALVAKVFRTQPLSESLDEARGPGWRVIVGAHGLTRGLSEPLISGAGPAPGFCLQILAFVPGVLLDHAPPTLFHGAGGQAVLGNSRLRAGRTRAGQRWLLCEELSWA